MALLRALRSGDVWGVLSGGLSALTLAVGEVFAVQLGPLSTASSVLGIVLGLYALAWFGLHLGVWATRSADVRFALQQGADEGEALLQIENQGEFTVSLEEVQVLYLDGQNEIERPPNTTVRNEYRVEQGEFTDGPTMEFRFGDQKLELGRGIQPDDEIRCLVFAWGAKLSPGASTNVGIDMDAADRGREVIPLLWIRVYPEVPVSALLAGWAPGLLDRLFRPIPLPMVEEAFALGVTPRVFGTEYARLDQESIDVEWPSEPESQSASGT